MEPFDIQSQNWDDYIDRFKQYLKAKKIEENLYVSELISTIGSAAYALLKSLCAPNSPDKKPFNDLVQIVKEHLKPSVSVVAKRHMFRHRYQDEDEDIINYDQDLRLLAKDCEFGELHDENLRDQLASGVFRDDIRQKLFSTQNLTYNDALNIIRSMETAEKSCRVKKNGIATNRAVCIKTIASGKLHGLIICEKCGRRHDKECPYEHFRCNICGVKGHLQKMCAQYKPYCRRDFKKRRYLHDSDSEDSFHVDIYRRRRS